MSFVDICVVVVNDRLSVVLTCMLLTGRSLTYMLLLTDHLSLTTYVVVNWSSLTCRWSLLADRPSLWTCLLLTRRALTCASFLLLSGRQYNIEGNLVQWWDNDTIDAFRKRAQCMIDQYSGFKQEQTGQYVSREGGRGLEEGHENYNSDDDNIDEHVHDRVGTNMMIMLMILLVYNGIRRCDLCGVDWFALVCS